MQFYDLNIDFEPSWDTYNKVSEILEAIPRKFEPSRFDPDGTPSTWKYRIEVNQEKEGQADFINKLLDILEPKVKALEAIGINKENILIWMCYEYYGQCSMCFSPQEMKRLGESGIPLNIDCFSTDEIE